VPISARALAGRSNRILPADLLLWIAVANSFAVDFLARKKVSLTMSYTVVDSQYIVTTTTEPPPELAREPFVIAQLSGTEEALRLLRTTVG